MLLAVFPNTGKSAEWWSHGVSYWWWSLLPPSFFTSVPFIWKNNHSVVGGQRHSQTMIWHLRNRPVKPGEWASNGNEPTKTPTWDIRHTNDIKTSRSLHVAHIRDSRGPKAGLNSAFQSMSPPLKQSDLSEHARKHWPMHFWPPLGRPQNIFFRSYFDTTCSNSVFSQLFTFQDLTFPFIFTFLCTFNCFFSFSRVSQLHAFV